MNKGGFMDLDFRNNQFELFQDYYLILWLYKKCFGGGHL